MHKLDENVLITPNLLRYFHRCAELEAGDGRYGAVIMRNNGSIITHALGPTLDGVEVAFAEDTLRALNNEQHYDGAWCILFTHYRAPPIVFGPDGGHYTSFTFLWMDHDGDIHVAVDTHRPLEVCMAWGLEHWLNVCATAWATARKIEEAKELRPDQQYRAALGEAAPSTVH